MQEASLEAASVYQEAAELAQQATRFELQDDFNLQQEKGYMTSPSFDETAKKMDQVLQEFDFCEMQRMTTIELLRSIKSPYCQPQQLRLKLEKLQNLLPEISLGDIIHTEIGFLHVSLSSMVQRMITLSIFFNNCDIVRIIQKEPRLVMDDDLSDNLSQALRKLKESFPGANDQVEKYIVDWLSNQPSTVYRLKYHMDKPYSELPIDMQNQLMFVGRQAGYVYESDDGFIDNHTD
eukprot:TRINITY_DN7772_c0_g1_i7.p3 TRINITY_DN7772_c0_g1~~TRINITY_DN7772_c0_g1_i7.p3  ORF type:complete len:235 (+),score=19.62 TRINITY_DN7772_c0_g1_i7:232-936(+)